MSGGHNLGVQMLRAFVLASAATLGLWLVQPSPAAAADCEWLASVASQARLAREGGKSLADVEQDLQRRIPDQAGLAASLEMARRVWADRTTPAHAVGRKAEAECRQAAGLPTPAAPPRAFVPCEVYADIAARLAHERNLGLTRQSRLDGLTRDPGADQAPLDVYRRMVRDLYDQPGITPGEAAWIARQSCGWPQQIPPGVR